MSDTEVLEHLLRIALELGPRVTAYVLDLPFKYPRHLDEHFLQLRGNRFHILLGDLLDLEPAREAVDEGDPVEVLRVVVYEFCNVAPLRLHEVHLQVPPAFEGPARLLHDRVAVSCNL